MTTYDDTQLVDAAKTVTSALTDYETLRSEVVDKLQVSERDSAPYLFGVLSRESEVISLARLAADGFEKIGKSDQPVDASRLAVFDRFGAPIAEAEDLFHPKGKHRKEHTKAIQEATEAKLIGAKIAKSLTAKADAVSKACIAFESRRVEAVNNIMAQLTTPPPKEKEPDVPDHQTDTPQEASQFDRLIDAVSALGGAQSSAPTANSYANFGLAVDQRLSLSIGMPNLGTEGAIAMSRSDLLSKLRDGLSRAVTTDVVGGVKTYSFNPLRARGASVDGSQAALGGQAVLNDTARALRGPIITAIFSLRRETGYQDHGESDDLRRAIEQGLDELVAETATSTGYFKTRVEDLFTQITLDVVSLAGLIGVLNRCDVTAIVPKWVNVNKRSAARHAMSIKPNFEAAIGIDPDIGVLTAESNDQALAVVFEHLTTLHNLMGRSNTGAILGRIRAINEVLPATVASVRMGLAAAGLSATELTVFAKHSDASSIDLGRLLGWIETESLTSRTVLLRDDLNLRDLDRLMTTRATQLEALQSLQFMEFQTTPNNRYAVGKRHIAELSSQIAELNGLLNNLTEHNLATTR